MISKLKQALNLVQNMGPRYVVFRISHELRRRTGLLKAKFPVDPRIKSHINLEAWKQRKEKFFFADISQIKLSKRPSEQLQQWFDNYQEGRLQFFSSEWHEIGIDYDWITNPDTGYQYDSKKHWTEIPDYSQEAGDIKFVWEKARFSFLYYLIRHDYYFERDHSKVVFDEILSFIEHNPINCGPNYRCSQEMSLRVLNWTFALYYYRNSTALTEEVFQKIIHHIYWHIRHVYDNINFSRIAVRNNHAITETMTLFLSGILFPFFPEAAKWKAKGKKWFQEEVAYQVYEDGTFLQFSMNYHRVVIQLLSWGIRLAELNGEKLGTVVYDRASASLHFLLNCLNEKDGHLPNYGANDGALFFPLNDAGYRDYRPQLNALAAVLKEGGVQGEREDQFWYGINDMPKKTLVPKQGISIYPVGGFYLLREAHSLTFVRCGSHKDRPSQADNLHLDIWVDGENILRDAGSFKYNAAEEDLRYFFGTASHNTVMLGQEDQMKKGGRFIWYYWTQCLKAGWKETEEYFEFEGIISAFKQIDPKITHARTIRKCKDTRKWEVIDTVSHSGNLEVNQLWHPTGDSKMEISFFSNDEKGNGIQKEMEKGWYSGKYGQKEESEYIVFSSNARSIKTIIEVKGKDTE